ncbi:P-loop NTPase fold protein [Streptomyces sp. NPDC055105]|uniref:P-loop NTPase fold protein n=1 Tax=Streptomyces sp. NPDC055105 TaxID=3365719 RepID=UPI0037D108BB
MVRSNMRVFAQPARRSVRTVERHFQDTIASPVIFGEHADLLSPSMLHSLQRLFPHGSAQMWGITPGKRDINVPKFRRMSPGDWVFFSGDKRLYFGGTVALTWHSPELAERLWSRDGNDQTMEHMYALADTRGFDIPLVELRDLLSWNSTRNIMGFMAFTQSESDLLQQSFLLVPSSPTNNPMASLPGLDADSASVADFLGNETEVDMLAKLAIAKITAPPLAVALLGEWGAGKSSFISQMSQRIDDLATKGASATDDADAFNTRVLQVQFNAWHYNDDHVWSGLVDHLFRALAQDLETDNAVENPESERKKRRDELERLEAEQRQLNEELDKTERKRPRGYLAFLGAPVEGLRLLYRAVRLGLRDLKYGWLYVAVWLLLIGAAIFAMPWLTGGVTVLVRATSAVAAPLLPLWIALRQRHSQGLSWTGKIRGSLEGRKRTLSEEITSARAQLAEIDAAVRLADFLTERGDTYQAQRGFMGSVHDDLFQLSEKLSAARADWEGAESTQTPPLERIILYIDDLDRCSPRRVVEVLAAVHLMLALPLFVVVVAVDPRWLLRSLEFHYSELFTDSAGTSHISGAQDTATPLDYLDKIFQVPFVVPPSTPEKTARLVNALLAPSSTPAPSMSEAGAQVDEAVASVDELENVMQVTEEGNGMGGGPTQLQLQPHEISFMSRVGGLTQTPRATKKLVNLYRLVRIGVPPTELARFEGDAQLPGEHQVVQILLALLVGSPHQCEEVFRAVLDASPSSKIIEVMRGVPSGIPVANKVADLIERMSADTPVVMDTLAYQQWCPRLARFSFYTRNLAT